MSDQITILRAANRRRLIIQGGAIVGVAAAALTLQKQRFEWADPGTPASAAAFASVADSPPPVAFGGDGSSARRFVAGARPVGRRAPGAFGTGRGPTQTGGAPAGDTLAFNDANPAAPFAAQTAPGGVTDSGPNAFNSGGGGGAGNAGTGGGGGAGGGDAGAGNGGGGGGAGGGFPGPGGGAGGGGGVPGPVPEPSTWALMALGGAIAAFMARRRRTPGQAVAA